MSVRTDLLWRRSRSERHARSATFVLAHGAWHGGWCWHRLAPLLRAAGHEVYTPTLTGLGERRHLAGPEIDLQTHIRDVVGLLEAEDLDQVILVGHSYAGFVITGVANVLSSRIGRLVYLDAFLPESGTAMTDYFGRPLEEVARGKGDGWRLPMAAFFDLAALGIRDTADAAWVEKRLADQPLKTFTQRLTFDPQRVSAVPCAYILTSGAPPFAQAASRARARGCRSLVLDGTGHDAMLTHPHELADALQSLVVAEG